MYISIVMFMSLLMTWINHVIYAEYFYQFYIYSLSRLSMLIPQLMKMYNDDIIY